jgi:cation diffusion facilitator family transporter
VSFHTTPLLFFDWRSIFLSSLQNDHFMMSHASINTHTMRRLLRLQWLCVLAGIGLMAIKFAAYFLTDSTAILTDALESIINVVAGFFALYSLSLSQLPADENHPYGHGKIEFFSAGLEGGLIAGAGILVVFKASYDFIYPPTLHRVDLGIVLTLVSGASNGLLGQWLLRLGKRYHSLTLEADGHHLMSDLWSSVLLAVGLCATWLTGWQWLDPVCALVLAGVLFWAGINLLRRAIRGLMDESDPATIREIARILNTHRTPQWVDIHNLRTQQYGHALHLDAHLVLPRFWSLEQTHNEVCALEAVLRNSHPTGQVEVFIVPEPCTPVHCSSCQLEDCPLRQSPGTYRAFSPETLHVQEPHVLDKMMR